VFFHQFIIYNKEKKAYNKKNKCFLNYVKMIQSDGVHVNHQADNMGITGENFTSGISLT